MSLLRFDWDQAKAVGNERKHEEAVSVFHDEHARLIADPDHSDREDRFVLLGVSRLFRILIVCHCDREKEGTIRIISARKANRSEIQQYEGFQ